MRKRSRAEREVKNVSATIITTEAAAAPQAPREKLRNSAVMMISNGKYVRAMLCRAPSTTP